MTFFSFFSSDRFRDFRQSEQTQLIVLSVIVGGLIGFAAAGFRELVDLMTRLLWSGTESPAVIAPSLPWWRILLVPAAGGLAVGLLIQFVAKEIKGHGVPEVMEALALREGRMRGRLAPLKALGSMITIGTGGSAGREGPIVMIGSSLGATIGAISRIPSRSVKILIAAGAAGGIGATFNTPIAGAIFAAEVILGDFGVANFTPVIIGSVLGTVVCRTIYGDVPTFPMPPHAFTFASPWELIPYALLGLLAAVAAVAFIKSMAAMTDLFESRPAVPQWVRPAAGGLLLGALALAVPQVLGVGYQNAFAILSEETTWPWTLMFLILGAKIIATSLTLGSGGSGGILSPTLLMGALLGGGLGTIVNAVAPFPTAGPGAYAMVGMGAFLAADTFAPLTAVLMLFELTANYRIILPLMLACGLATLIATRLSKVSIYTEKLWRRGTVLSRGREVNILRNIPVRDVGLKPAATVAGHTSLIDLLRLMAASTHSRFFLLDAADRLSGTIDLVDLRQVVPEQEHLRNVLVAEDIATHPVRTVTPDTGLDRVMAEFGRSHVDELPVVETGTDDHLLGVIRRQDVVARYNREILTRDLASEISRGVEEVTTRTMVPLGDRYLLAELPVPPPLRGRLLSESELRTRYRVEVVMIRPRDGGEAVLPHSDHLLTGEDLLLVVGERDAVQHLYEL